MESKDADRAAFRRLSELEVIYNPSLGAYLIWSAVKAYSTESGGKGMPLPLVFIVLPLVLHWQSREIGAATLASSGLTLFAAKLGAHQEDLLAVHQRALAFRELSLSSVAVASASRMLYVNPADAAVSAIDISKVPNVPEDVRQLRNVAAKFGVWFARLPIQQVATVLRVEF